MDLVRAFKTEDGLTENGGTTHTTSSNEVTDLFFQIGAFRTRNEASIIQAFRAALADNPLDAMKILFYSRDIRGGQGERRTFRILLKDLAGIKPEYVRRNLSLISEYGRWDDLFVLEGTKLEDEMLSFVAKILLDDCAKLGMEGKAISLAGKWVPSEGAKKNPTIAKKLMKKLEMTPKRYRKMLTKLRKELSIVEILMCSNDWGSINFEHVPSYAMKNYRKSFARNDSERWGGYIESLEKGEARVNASTLFPHDLIRQCDNYLGDDIDYKLIEQQWKALPNYMKDSNEKILPMCDVSGSMIGLPMDVSVSLGLYIAERNKGIFKDVIMTFTEQPRLFTLKGKGLKARYDEVTKTVGYNTDIDKVFSVLLDKAVAHKVSEDNMPTMLLIFSDMEFDSNEIAGTSMTAFKALNERYAKAGYNLPKIVFWNLNANGGNFPVKYDKTGTILISGFSPSILTSLLSGRADFSPIGIMKQTIDSDRYKAITI